MVKKSGDELIKRLKKEAARYRAQAACCSDPKRKASLLDNMRLCRAKAVITERIIPSPQPAANGAVGAAGNGVLYCKAGEQ